ncbi:Hydroxyethylthiazole kinase [Furfurilactobacillus rossiae]|uniref:hydroxyethylthiazole kinase n=1 Tax=Furfurilactobacillus rossiae TaxID=231049 RepID=UPI0015BB7A85|nr:hydroxyethylthiazole kinase [Furfurilactobacillus rossiae]MCF6165024.1 hydroxyethylthiazole kinase [Furfurilactobacillus rossiae]QLE64096.1 Hydroxyethylthiazole kinase [Furfurilactobacillus rossiae]
MNLSLLETIRKTNPVVFTVANSVTIAEVANAVNAIGASPIMSKAKEEAGDLVGIAGAVALNLGTWTPDQIGQMVTVGSLANQHQRPVVIDPVAVGLPSRRQQFDRLIANIQPTVIRANAGEMAALSGDLSNSKGIDATGAVSDPKRIIQAVALHYHCVAVMTGAVDWISDGQQTVSLHVGTPLFATHVGSGDMLSSVLAAYLAVEPNAMTAAVTGTAIFGATGQWAVNQADLTLMQPGSFGIALMDSFSQVTAETLSSYLKDKVVDE